MTLKYEIELEVNYEVYGDNPKDAMEDWKRAVEYALTNDLNQWDMTTYKLKCVEEHIL